MRRAIRPSLPESQSEQVSDKKNAAKRGGPKTQKGKEKSKHNAVRHGIFSEVVLLKGEPKDDLDCLLNGFHDFLEPNGTLENLLVDKLAATVWRHRRLIIAENELIANTSELIELNLNRGPRLEVLLRYESNLERAFDRTLSQLERIQRIRSGDAVPPPVNVSVSHEFERDTGPDQASLKYKITKRTVYVQ
jgi:hypothetical protein